MSNDEWNFKKKDEYDDYSYYIENISKSKVLAAKDDGEIVLEDFEEDKVGQIWMKIVSDDEGYSTLQNSRVLPKGIPFWPFMTAISSNTLRIQGIYTPLR